MTILVQITELILLQIQQGKGEIHIIKPHKSQVISKESTVPAKPVE
jgi:hypothetical protein